MEKIYDIKVTIEIREWEKDKHRTERFNRELKIINSNKKTLVSRPFANKETCEWRALQISLEVPT